MLQYNSLEMFDEMNALMDEGFSKDKPQAKPGYKIEKVKKMRVGKKLVSGGYKQVKVSKAPSKIMSKAKLKQRGRKAALTKKSKGSGYARKISKKRVATNKANR